MNHTKTAMMIAVSILSLLVVASPLIAADSSAEIPSSAIPISSSSDLALMGSTGASGAYPLSGYYYLTKDITLTGTNNITPIGTQTAPFTGTLDGDGYKISGINFSTTTLQNTGLFAWADGATICNLTLDNLTLSSTYNNSQTVGGIVGTVSSKGITVTNTSVVGSISTNNNNAGGIVGTATTATFVNCSFEGSVTSKTGLAGGLIAQGGSGNQGITILQSHNSGNISTTDDIIGVAGGLIGLSNYFTIANCYNTGSISGKVAGGLVGNGSHPSTIIIDSYNTGNISAEGTNVASAGGIAGAMFGSIFNCYSTGSVSCTATTANIGGISGDSPRIANCYYLSDKLSVDGSSTTDIITTISGVNIDGFSDPTRSGDQESGAKTSSKMKPSLSNAKGGQSIFYTGTTHNLALSVPGWNFTDIWTIDPLKNDGYPTLQMSDTYTELDDLLTLSFSYGDEVVKMYVVPGDTITPPDDPVFEGYTFLFWFIYMDEDPYGIIQLDFSKPITKSAWLDGAYSADGTGEGEAVSGHEISSFQTALLIICVLAVIVFCAWRFGIPGMVAAGITAIVTMVAFWFFG